MNLQDKLMVDRAVELAVAVGRVLQQVDDLEVKLADSRKVNTQLSEDRRDLMHAAGFPEEADAFEAAEQIRQWRQR